MYAVSTVSLLRFVACHIAHIIKNPFALVWFVAWHLPLIPFAALSYIPRQRLEQYSFLVKVNHVHIAVALNASHMEWRTCSVVEKQFVAYILMLNAFYAGHIISAVKFIGQLSTEVKPMEFATL